MRLSSAPFTLPLLVLCLASCSGEKLSTTSEKSAGGPADFPFVARATDFPELSSLGQRIYASFDGERAQGMVAFVDQFHRLRGNEGYQRTLDEVEAELVALRDAAASRGDASLSGATLRRLALGEKAPAWTGRRASLAYRVSEDDPWVELSAFDSLADRRRTALMAGSANLPEGIYTLVPARGFSDIGLSFEEAREPEVLRGLAPDHFRGKAVLAHAGGYSQSREMRAYLEAGALALLTSQIGLYPVHRIEAAAGMLEEAIPVATMPRRREDDGLFPGTLGFSLSPAQHRELATALGCPLRRREEARPETLRSCTQPRPLQIRVRSETHSSLSEATTLEFVLPGRSAKDAVVFMSDVDGAGANDDASGVAMQLELLRAIVELQSAGKLPQLEFSLVFLWGTENDSVDAWLAQNELQLHAAFTFDMVGNDPSLPDESVFLLERMPDPSVSCLRGPDMASGWGFPRDSCEAPSEELQQGHWINDYSWASISLLGQALGGWRARTNPHEGGSDQVSFLQGQVPAVLAWHFPDWAYETNLDRIERVDEEEMRRVAAAIAAVALGIAAHRQVDHLEMRRALQASLASRVQAHCASLPQGAPATSSASLSENARACDPSLERAIAEAWQTWFRRAFTQLPSRGSSTAPLDAEVEGLLDAARREIEACLAAC